MEVERKNTRILEMEEKNTRSRVIERVKLMKEWLSTYRAVFLIN